MFWGGLGCGKGLFCEGRDQCGSSGGNQRAGGGDSWEEKRGKILSEGFSRKVNFQPELQVKTVCLEKPETGEKSQSGK